MYGCDQQRDGEEKSERLVGEPKHRRVPGGGAGGGRGGGGRVGREGGKKDMKEKRKPEDPGRGKKYEKGTVTWGSVDLGGEVKERLVSGKW